ncbi:SDR family NAD(P)-dependent oxidoreductase [Pectobacterium carotovorum]|uniref:Probable oxidoreductase n=1 Tax=Pectobacterium carotovorum subsp. carotovorum TaxID=555 RepID=A0AAI9L3G5_PECCC|nr:SDR family NAD(P)-dependent oxidoreductase [Pectobacterium carotovorum]QRN39254.1 SDR family NAD(P)-dependent oxidoreductase [Pectobacterium carotovorum]GKV92315.1 oxidoreductase [Pectobacterium carotovorum subsp. carotovorum]GKX48634.1 oxidoreductase [Pectobacterium carotovorum subsp. carotovorum]GLV71077.1 oxidoreductase [Pectobacterium carotovorum subsp. carotovorum]
MTTKFDFYSTTDEVLKGIDLRGKRILVTGVSAGLGLETARVLVEHGAEVIGTARNIAKAESATSQIREIAGAGNGTFEIIQLDLADLKSVKACVEGLLNMQRHLDIIIANAGIMAAPFGKTMQGFESQFGTNYLGHFALITRLALLMQKGSRIVMLSSAAHHIADVDLNDINFEHSTYDKWVAYGRSKTACALLAVEFDRRYRDKGIRATAVHPGGIRTELQRHYPEQEEAALVASINAANAEAGLPPFEYKTIPQGAATSVWAAVVADAEQVGGRYCEDCHVAEIDDSEGIHGGIRSYACSPERANALWNIGEELLGNHR